MRTVTGLIGSAVTLSRVCAPAATLSTRATAREISSFVFIWRYPCYVPRLVVTTRESPIPAAKACFWFSFCRCSIPAGTALLQRLLDRVFHVRFADQPYYALDHFAGTVNVHGKRQALRRIQVAHVVVASEDRVVQLHLVSKRQDFLVGGVVLGHAQDHKPLVAILFLQLHQPGHLDLAGLAPGGPKVDQNSFALE